MGQRQTKNRQKRRAQAGLHVAMKELKPVHMLSPEHREFQSLVKHRQSLDPRINKFKNTICEWFVNHGITLDVGDKAWRTGRARIKTLEPLARSPE